jgi:outer membrane protein
MKKTIKCLILYGVFLLLIPKAGICQVKDSIWTLNRCIEYALEKNISIQKTVLGSETNRINLEETRASMFPSVSASASQNYGWGRQLNSNNEYSGYTGFNNTNFGISSSVRLYNGLKTLNSIRQSELTYEAGKYDIETIRESISLSILEAYLQVLYADEQVKNGEAQVASTTEQLRLAEERLNLGAISRSDYLLVKSELASENLTLANAQSTLITNRVTLMQLMEIPVTSDFTIEHPDLGLDVYQVRNPNTDSVYSASLAIKPQIKSAEINTQLAKLDVAIAKAAYQPVLSLSGGLTTGYSSKSSPGFSNQIDNEIGPSIGLSLSVPIYQNRKAKSGVALAKIGSQTAELDDINTKNQLRKEIEQACTDVYSAEKKYEASREQYNANLETYAVATEKYNVGLLNSVDFIIQKTSMINAESDFLQSKYNLVFSSKILDFYQGIPLSF